MIRALAFILTVGAAFSHAVTEGVNMWSNHLVRNLEVVSLVDPFIQFQSDNVPVNEYFRIYSSQSQSYSSFLALLLSAKASGSPVTVITSAVGSSPQTHLLRDS